MSKMHMLHVGWYVTALLALLAQFAIGPAACANTFFRLLLESFAILITWAALAQSVYVLLPARRPRAKLPRRTALALIILLAAAASVGVTFYNIHASTWQCLV